MNGAFDISVGAAIEDDPRAIDRLLTSIRPFVVRYCRARVGRLERDFATADGVAQEVMLAVLTALPSYRDQSRPFLAFVYGIAAHTVSNVPRSQARSSAEYVDDVPDTLAVDPEGQAFFAEEPPSFGRAVNGRLGIGGVVALLARSSLGTASAAEGRRWSAAHDLDARATAIVTDILGDHEMEEGCEESAAHSADLAGRMAALLSMLPDKQREIVLLRVVIGLSAEETAEALNSTPGAVRVAQHRALAKLRQALTVEEVC
jgi:RNA polymerase sigma factor (sigma-70 family)